MQRPLSHDPGRRRALKGGLAGLAVGLAGCAKMLQEDTTMADLIIFNARVTTLDAPPRAASAIAVADGRIMAVGSDAEVRALATPATRSIDAGGRRLIPGLNDSHTHLIRGGLNYNLELRWDGVRSLADAMAMLRAQVARTPAPQWVRIVGGFSEHQFVEKRLPTLDEINAAAPDTPVFILHLYDRALLNRAALRAVGYDKDSPDPPGGRIERDKAGNPTGLLLAKPNALILYATLAMGPKLPPEYQINSSRHFMRELNRLGITSVIDAGGGFQNYPEDYEIIQKLHDEDQLTVRIAYNLFTQKKGGELADFERWTKLLAPRQGDPMLRHNGAGEMLVFSAADFEDFREPRPELAQGMEGELEDVVRLLAAKRWPFRIHATYDQSITRVLDVYEAVDREVPFDGLHWIIDHAETISDRNIERVRALNGGIAIQHRMAYQGEFFAERYGAEALKRAPPLRRMLDLGVPVTGIAEAVFARALSGSVPQRRAAAGLTSGKLGERPTETRQFIEDVRQALYASKIIAYAQGFNQIQAGSDEYGWGITPGVLATIWRGGCIIRAKFLNRIKDAFDADPDLATLLADPYFRGAVESAVDGWRRVVVTATELGIPIPGFASALSYYDALRTERLPAAVIQGQRDFFGAHTYGRIDADPSARFHTLWSGDRSEVRV